MPYSHREDPELGDELYKCCPAYQPQGYVCVFLVTHS